MFNIGDVVIIKATGSFCETVTNSTEEKFAIKIQNQEFWYWNDIAELYTKERAEYFCRLPEILYKENNK